MAPRGGAAYQYSPPPRTPRGLRGGRREALPLRLGASGVTEQGPDGPDGTDLEILSLLLAGLTDASVAKQLDLGLRTVQRRVKRLMELTGVTTRLQLGRHAYERGWVTRDRAG